MTLPVYSPKREATLPDQQAWHTGQLTFDPSFHLSRRATLQPILWLLRGRRGHSWHSSTVLCWAVRASTHQHHPFTQEISVKPNGLYSRACVNVCVWMCLWECVDVCLFLLLELLQIIMITVLEQFGCLCMSQCVYQAFLAFTWGMSFIPNIDFSPPANIFMNTNINFSLCRYCKTKRNERRETDGKDRAPFQNECVTGAVPNEPICMIRNWSAWRSVVRQRSWATSDKRLDTTLRADLHTTRRVEEKKTPRRERTREPGRKIYAAEVKPHFVWWAMLNNNWTGGQLPWLECCAFCESHRDGDGVSGRGGVYPHLLPPPLATEAQCSLACMLLQAWPKQSMLSTLFISK